MIVDSELVIDNDTKIKIKIEWRFWDTNNLKRGPEIMKLYTTSGDDWSDRSKWSEIDMLIPILREKLRTIIMAHLYDELFPAR